MFSVIIPYYKKRKYIERCIDAVLAQTYQGFEIILVDDGSQDDVAQLIEEKYSGKVQLIQQENKGVSAARNTGIAAATNDYIAFLDADDYWSPFYLEKVAYIIKQEKNIKIIGSHYSRTKSNIETENRKLHYFLIKDYFKNALRVTYFFTSGTVVLREFFKQEDGFNTNLKSGEDLDVWFRAVLSGGKAFYIKNTLSYYSDEDENQASVAVLKNVENRFVTNMHSIYFRDAKKIYPQEFYDFLSKYIYSGLYNFKYNKDAKNYIRKIESSITTKYFFAELFYRMPYKVGTYLIKHKRFRKFARLYFKFIFKYIHN